MDTINFALRAKVATIICVLLSAMGSDTKLTEDPILRHVQAGVILPPSDHPIMNSYSAAVREFTQAIRRRNTRLPITLSADNRLTN
jgi:hypothetical protein